MEEVIAAELFSEAVQAKVWSALRPDDLLLQKVVQDTEKAFEEFLNEHPHLAERAKAWHNSQEEI